MKKWVLLAFLCVVNHSFAQVAAKVLSTTKEVMAQHNGSTRALSRGSSLDVGDAVITKAGGNASIKYSNGTIVDIGENSHYIILSYAPKSSDVQIKAELTQGSIASKTTGHSKETLKTPVIAMAILGTKYAVLVQSKTNTYVNVSEGRVQIGNTTLSPGESVLATPNGVINAPFPDPEMLKMENEKLDEESAAQGTSSEEDGSGAFSEEGGIDTGDYVDVGGDIEPDFDTGGEDVVGALNSVVVGESVAEDLPVEEEIECMF